MKVLAVVLIAGLIAMAQAQTSDMLQMMMLMRMMGGNSGASSGSSAAGGAGASSGGLAGLLGGAGGRGGMNPLMLMGGGDRMRDMMMCNMLPRTMRSLCIARAFQ